METHTCTCTCTCTCTIDNIVGKLESRNQLLSVSKDSIFKV